MKKFLKIFLLGASPLLEVIVTFVGIVLGICIVLTAFLGIIILHFLAEFPIGISLIIQLVALIIVIFALGYQKYEG